MNARVASHEKLAALGIAVKEHGNAEQRTVCPHCSKGDRDDVLGVNVETGVFHCFRCGWAGIADTAKDANLRVVRYDDPAVAERKRERLRRTWRESLPLEHVKAHAVRQYLLARGLGAVLKRTPRTLRVHPGLEYWDGTRSLGTFPAMLGLFSGAGGDAVTLHVTYLRADGVTKAPVPSPKKILGVPVQGATKGGSIRLHEPRNGVLGIAEGIETALSLHVLHGIPVWAAFCAENMKAIRLPDGLRQVYIGVDLDPAGESAAKGLADRLMRWRRAPQVFYVKPDGAGDLNDELMRSRA